jgi:hypothetical protein
MTATQTPPTTAPVQQEPPNRGDAKPDATHGDLGAVKAIKVWGIASAAVLGVSVLLPWITVFGAGVALIAAADGKILLVAAAVAVALTVWRPQSIGARVLAVVAGGLGLYEFIQTYVAINDGRAEAGAFGGLVSVGFGAYLACLAALSLVAWAVFTQFKQVSGPKAVATPGRW